MQVNRIIYIVFLDCEGCYTVNGFVRGQGNYSGLMLAKCARRALRLEVVDSLSCFGSFFFGAVFCFFGDGVEISGFDCAASRFLC